MDYDKLIERLNTKLQSYALYTDSEFTRAMEDAITAIETLRLESDAQEMQLNEFSEFLCHMTGGMLSKTNYTAQAMISAAEDYQQRVCDNYCDLRADLARVTVERDGAIKDLNEFLSMDELCPIQCEWCKWNGTYCDGKTPEWRGIKKED